MKIIINVKVLFAFIFVSIHGSANAECGDRLKIDNVARSVSELPQDIRSDLETIFGNNRAFPGGLGEPNDDLFDSDVRDEADQHKLTIRFRVAQRVGNQWFVSLDQAYPHNQTVTLGYDWTSQGDFRRSPFLLFAGPVCDVLIAAKNGVVAPPKGPFYPT